MIRSEQEWTVLEIILPMPEEGDDGTKLPFCGSVITLGFCQLLCGIRYDSLSPVLDLRQYSPHSFVVG